MGMGTRVDRPRVDWTDWVLSFGFMVMWSAFTFFFATLGTWYGLALATGHVPARLGFAFLAGEAGFVVPSWEATLLTFFVAACSFGMALLCAAWRMYDRGRPWLACWCGSPFERLTGLCGQGHQGAS